MRDLHKPQLRQRQWQKQWLLLLLINLHLKYTHYHLFGHGVLQYLQLQPVL